MLASAGSTLRVDVERVDLDLTLDLDRRACVSSEMDAFETYREDLTLDGALEDDRRDGAKDAEQPRNDTAEACTIALRSLTCCLDFDLARPLLAIDRDLPLGASSWTSFDRLRPRE